MVDLVQVLSDSMPIMANPVVVNSTPDVASTITSEGVTDAEAILNAGSTNVVTPETVNNPVLEVYAKLLNDVKNHHAILNGDWAETGCQRLENDCLRILNDEITAFSAIEKRIERRNQFRSEVDYYMGKLNKLNKLKSQRGHEDVSYNEKIERNTKKLDAYNFVFNAYNTALINDLQTIWSSSHLLVVPVMARFIQLEKGLGCMLVTSLDPITDIDAQYYQARNIASEFTDIERGMTSEHATTLAEHQDLLSPVDDEE
jgi:hypothetical protein